MRKHAAITLVTSAVALVALLTACYDSADEKFPAYALPHSIHAPGSVGGGAIAVNSGALRADIWFVATDADLDAAKDEIRASLVTHGWNVQETADSAIGVGWYGAVSPDGETCLRYLTVESDNVPWTNDDPLLTVYSYADWIRMLGDYHHLLIILSERCTLLTSGLRPPSGSLHRANLNDQRLTRNP